MRNAEASMHVVELDADLQVLLDDVIDRNRRLKPVMLCRICRPG
jgi:hypothetical protein